MATEKKNTLALWREFDADEKHPQARGDGIVGVNDYRIRGSMWRSRSGVSSSGKKWQVWNVSLQPARDETRELVAVPKECLDKVLEIIKLTDAPNGEEAGDTAHEAVDDDSLPF